MKTCFVFLNDNLVIKKSGYIDDNYSYSFLGKNQINQNIETLLDGHLFINHLPEEIIKQLSLNTITIKEDKDNHDYLYDIQTIVNMPGKEFARKRYFINKYNRTYRDIDFKLLNLENDETLDDFLSLTDKWFERKNSSGEHSKEQQAIKRLLGSLKCFDLVILGLYVNNDLVGYTINEINDKIYVTGHFAKTDPDFSNSFDYLIHNTCKYFLENTTCRSLNMEQDMGLTGLRNFKLSWNPNKLFKKYRLDIK